VTYGYEGENVHFLDCIAKGCETTISFAEALKSQELAERIEQGSQHSA
jgi:predicted dehydrogenase